MILKINDNNNKIPRAASKQASSETLETGEMMYLALPKAVRGYAPVQRQ